MNCEGQPSGGFEKKKWCAHLKSSHSSCRWREKGTVILLFIIGSALVAHGQGSSLSEYQLKAAFLFNFAKFIDWPQSAFANPQSPFTICIFGKDPFGSSLDEALAKKTIGDRSISILRTKDKMELKHCHIVFVSHPETEHIAEFFERRFLGHAFEVMSL